MLSNQVFRIISSYKLEFCYIFCNPIFSLYGSFTWYISSPRVFANYICFIFCSFVLPESGKLITWGSTDDLGQSYVTSGKHGVVQHYIVLSILVVLIVLLVNLPALFQLSC